MKVEGVRISAVYPNSPTDVWLRACPFCNGSPSIVYDTYREDGENFYHYKIGCDNCVIYREFEEMGEYGVFFAITRAVNWWNGTEKIKKEMQNIEIQYSQFVTQKEIANET